MSFIGDELRGYVMLAPGTYGISVVDHDLLAALNDRSDTFEPVVAKIRELWIDPEETQ